MTNKRQSAGRALSRYRRLRPLFPRAWRESQEREFLETLQELEREEQCRAMPQLIDLLQLALVLQARALLDRVMGRTTTVGVYNRYAERIRASGPTAGIVALACLLLVPVLHLGHEIPPEFVLTSLLVVAVPGIGVLYTVSSALAGGRERGLLAAIGCTLGIIPHLIVAALGLSGLMQLGAVVFEVVRWTGVAYLAWMGLGMIRQRGAFCLESPRTSHDAASTVDSSTEEGSCRKPGRVIIRGVLLNALNPKLTLFFFAFIPQFLDIAPVAPIASGSSGLANAMAATIDPRLIGLGSLFMLLTLGGFVLYALAGVAIRRLARRAPSALDLAQGAIGALLLGFAARLALVER